MWKIFRCKRGEERGFIPGEYAKLGVSLSPEKGIEFVINKVKEFVNPKIKMIEDEEKVVVQNQRKFMGIVPVYETFLEIYKKQMYRSFPEFRSGDLPRFKIITYECKPTKEVVKVFDILERYT